MKNSYHLKEDGFETRWFAGARTQISNHGSRLRSV